MVLISARSPESVLFAQRSGNLGWTGAHPWVLGRVCFDVAGKTQRVNCFMKVRESVPVL